MKPIHVFLTVIFFFTILLSSCKTKGCKNYFATNYDAWVELDDGSCVFPTAAEIVMIDVLSYPSFDSTGTLWDASDSADIFIRIDDLVGNIICQTPIEYEHELKYYRWSMSNINVSSNDILKISLYDDDNGFDQIMVDSALFDLGQYSIEGTGSEKYPYNIEVNKGQYYFRLSVLWK